jgi:hypothetical protein
VDTEYEKAGEKTIGTRGDINSKIVPSQKCGK